MRIRGALKYAMGGDTLRGCYNEVKQLNLHEDGWLPLEMRDWRWRLRVIFPRITAAKDLAGFLVERIACYCFGHRWVEQRAIDGSNQREMLCVRCGFSHNTYL